MKKSYSMLAASGLLLFSACSNEDDAPQSKGVDSSAQELVFQVASSGDGLTTRAGRPLYSSEAAQNINNVKVVIRDASNNKVVYTTEITDWNTKSQVYATGGHGKQYTLSLKGDDKLPEGTYKVTAYGYVDSSTDYDFSPATINKDDEVAGTISAMLKTGKMDAEEVFAGELSDLTVNAQKVFSNITVGGTTSIVTLNRQVAGTFGYFDHIPASVDGKAVKFIRLVSVDKNKKVNFTNFANGQSVSYVVNGDTPFTADAAFFNATPAHEIFTIKISDWFTGGDNGGATGGSGSANGTYDSDDTWAVPAGLSAAKFKTGSVFSGKFIIPFSRSDSHGTLELQLLADGAPSGTPGAVIKYWNIYLPAADTQLTGLAGETATSYSLVRNHLYSIGAKTNANPNDPNNPTDPDVEQPENLSKGEDLTLKVNDNWEMLHRLVID